MRKFQLSKIKDIKPGPLTPSQYSDHHTKLIYPVLACLLLKEGLQLLMLLLQ